MGAVFPARDKIDVVVLLRVSGSFEAGEARRADGAGRQAGVLVGVVGVALVVEMFAPQIAVEPFPEPVGGGGLSEGTAVSRSTMEASVTRRRTSSRPEGPGRLPPGQSGAVLRQKLSISRPTTDFAVASLSSSGRMIR